jgi:hypothetical protein
VGKGVHHFLTYADNFATGYFKKQVQYNTQLRYRRFVGQTLYYRKILADFRCSKIRPLFAPGPASSYFLEVSGPYDLIWEYPNRVFYCTVQSFPRIACGTKMQSVASPTFSNNPPPPHPSLPASNRDSRRI